MAGKTANISRRILLFGVLILSSACTSGPPEFQSLTELDNTSSAIGPYEVVAVVVDEGIIERVELIWRVDGGEWESRVMEEVNSTTFASSIPGQPVGSSIEYECAALDDDGEVARIPEDDAFITFAVVPTAQKVGQ
ncbi:MAG: hypothetical protein ACI9OJ_005576 [Myxococcota bacterium]|jgi:hypothetical protein